MFTAHFLERIDGESSRHRKRGRPCCGRHIGFVRLKVDNIIWDEKDRIESWRIDKHEMQSAKPKAEDENPATIIPQPFAHTYWRQLLTGDLLDCVEVFFQGKPAGSGHRA